MKREGKIKTNNTYPSHMKELREENKLTQQQVADLLNLERSSIAKYESGQSSPNPETLLTMAKIYNVSVDYLIRGSQSSAISSVVNSSTAPYGSSSSLPLMNTQHMYELTDDEQFLVLYFRMLDRDPKIIEQLRKEYNDRTKND